MKQQEVVCICINLSILECKDTIKYFRRDVIVVLI